MARVHDGQRFIVRLGHAAQRCDTTSASDGYGLGRSVDCHADATESVDILHSHARAVSAHGRLTFVYRNDNAQFLGAYAASLVFSVLVALYFIWGRDGVGKVEESVEASAP